MNVNRQSRIAEGRKSLMRTRRLFMEEAQGERNCFESMPPYLRREPKGQESDAAAGCLEKTVTDLTTAIINIKETIVK
jgi:hypothetical protein